MKRKTKLALIAVLIIMAWVLSMFIVSDRSDVYKVALTHLYGGKGLDRDLRSISATVLVGAGFKISLTEPSCARLTYLVWRQEGFGMIQVNLHRRVGGVDWTVYEELAGFVDFSRRSCSVFHEAAVQ